MSRKMSSIDGQVDGEPEIVSVIDETASARTFVIADLSRDESWLSVPASDAATLNAQR